MPLKAFSDRVLSMDFLSSLSPQTNAPLSKNTVNINTYANYEFLKL